jgi:hypothetical protein
MTRSEADLRSESGVHEVSRESITTLLESMLTVVTLLLACLSSLVAGGLPDRTDGKHNAIVYEYAQAGASILLTASVIMATLCWMACLAFMTSMNSSKLGENLSAWDVWYREYRHFIGITLFGCFANAIGLMTLLLSIGWMNSPVCMYDCSGTGYMAAVGVFTAIAVVCFMYLMHGKHTAVLRQLARKFPASWGVRAVRKEERKKKVRFDTANAHVVVD